MANRQSRRAAAKAEKKTPAPKPIGPNGISCRSCPYWLVAEGEDRKKLERASCVRLPATVVPERKVMPGIGGQMVAVDTGGTVTQFPVMLWWGVCGEHPHWPVPRLETGR